MIDGNDPTAMQQANVRHIPVLLVEGQLNELANSADGPAVRIHARVDFSIRRIPVQTLKGTLRGSASGTLPARASEKHVIELQHWAIEGAVESALREADLDLTLAAR